MEGEYLFPGQGILPGNNYRDNKGKFIASVEFII
jgi:hypothetical protein